VKLKLLVPALLLAFVVCVALGGQARAVDDVGGDSDDIAFADDFVFTGQQPAELEPPAVTDRVLSWPSESNSGRLVIADLFRPPIAA